MTEEVFTRKQLQDAVAKRLDDFEFAGNLTITKLSEEVERLKNKLSKFELVGFTDQSEIISRSGHGLFAHKGTDYRWLDDKIALYKLKD